MKTEIFLTEAMRRQAYYQLQYADYDKDTWTMPARLNDERLQNILTDHSIHKIKIEIEL